MHRETTASPVSTLDLRSSRICSSWRDTIPASHRSPLLAAQTPIVSYPILAGSAMVQYASMSNMSRGADIRDCVNPSELDRATYQRHQLRPASRGLAHDRGLGGLWNLEVCVHVGVCNRPGLNGRSPRPNITIFFTILAVAVSFAWLGVEDASRWEAGVALYILGCKCPVMHEYLHCAQ